MLHCLCNVVQVQGLKFRDALSSNYVALYVLYVALYVTLYVTLPLFASLRLHSHSKALGWQS